jgi:deoxyribodipyrimidine photolyase-related protein
MKLVLILGDQLDHDSAALRDFSTEQDAVAMVEVAHESQVVWSHKVRTVFFLSAMRHFAAELEARGIRVFYQRLDDPGARSTFLDALAPIVEAFAPQRLVVTEPGEHRVGEELEELSRRTGVPLEIRRDESFFCSREEFAQHCQGRRQLRMEYFYRELRTRHGILMDGKKPAGGEWNFDHENRKSFGKKGPPSRRDLGFAPDATTREVMRVVEALLPQNPGTLSRFEWPVTAAQADELLDHFVDELLPAFGDWQDAMWEGEPFLFHSKLSCAMNVRLLAPRKVVAAVERAYREGRVPIAAAEGFVRQILGWREYVRGIYHQFMPQYLERNALKATLPLPEFYWTGSTHMSCMASTIRQTLEYGYAHHIQRLMVTGLFALLYGVDPKEVHRWYLAVYVDAVEWVELPNTLGMGQYADGGVMASKPYIASGKYIERMSNHCKGCRYDPAKAHGADACPFTTLYWDFINRHADLIGKNPRLGMQLKNWRAKDPADQQAILLRARELRQLAAPEVTARSAAQRDPVNS